MLFVPTPALLRSSNFWLANQAALTMFLECQATLVSRARTVSTFASHALRASLAERTDPRRNSCFGKRPVGTCVPHECPGKRLACDSVERQELCVPLLSLHHLPSSVATTYWLQSKSAVRGARTRDARPRYHCNRSSFGLPRQGYTPYWICSSKN
eukprot:2957148-Pleurochrysis_carterae.AAC.3